VGKTLEKKKKGKTSNALRENAIGFGERHRKRRLTQAVQEIGCREGDET